MIGTETCEVMREWMCKEIGLFRVLSFLTSLITPKSTCILEPGKNVRHVVVELPETDTRCQHASRDEGNTIPYALHPGCA